MSGYRRCTSRVTNLTVDIDGTVSGVIADEFACLHKLRLGGRSQVQDGNISINDFSEWFRFGKFSAQIKHGDNPGAQSFVRRTAPQFAANPDLWCDLVPRSTLPPVIQHAVCVGALFTRSISVVAISRQNKTTDDVDD